MKFTDAAATVGRKEGLIVKEVGAKKIEGEYHRPNGCIQFSSEVRGSDRSLTVSTTEGEPIVIMRKPKRASMMTMTMGQTKLLVQVNHPSSGLPRYSDYVVPQTFHNLMDVALMQNRVSYALLQHLERRNTNETRRRAIEDLVTRSEANSIIEAAKALGNAGVMGTDNPAAQQFYVLAMRLMKIKDMMKSGEVDSSDSMPHPLQNSKQRQKRLINFSCPRCITGSCPYKGDRSNECNGMCGRKCDCWWWVCGDCCVHQGCVQHDNCCIKHGFYSVACLAPIGFSCSGYSC